MSNVIIVREKMQTDLKIKEKKKMREGKNGKKLKSKRK